MNGILWVVEIKEKGNWVSVAFSETQSEARLTAQAWKYAFPEARVRKYVRVEE